MRGAKPTMRPNRLALAWVIVGIVLAGRALAGSALAGSALADAAPDHPPYAPTRDVAVEYQVRGAGLRAPGTERMFYSAGDTRARFEATGRSTYVIMDHASRRLIMVMAKRHAYLEKPFGPKPGRGFGLDGTMQFAREGEDRVAGRDCTEWRIRSDAASVRACITGDGVLLRARDYDPRYKDASMEAKSVVYAPQDQGLFQPPPGYQKLTRPDRPPG